MILLSAAAFLLLLGFHGVCCSDCSPGFADSCFTGVTNDLKYMLNLKDSVAVNISQDAVHDLCLTLDEAFQCASDIIEEDCSEEDGRSQFESWMQAIGGAYDYVCADESKLKEILQGIQCWSIDEFMLCSEEYLKLTHIGDLLHTNIDEVECQNLRTVTRDCYYQARTGSCRENDEISASIGLMISAFFEQSYCNHEDFLESDAAASIRIPLHLLSFLIGTLILLM